MSEGKSGLTALKWIKITTDIFDDEKILLIESLPEADSIIVIWFKLLCLAGKQNNSGVFLMNDRIPYTDRMLATIFRRKEATIKMALETFEQFGMIEIVDGVITIPNWGKHQSADKIEARSEYMRQYMTQYRNKQKLLIDCNVNSKVNSKANVNSLEEEVEKEKDIEEITEEISEEKESDSSDLKEKTNIPWEKIKNLYNETCVSLPKIKSITSDRKKHISGRFNQGFTIDDFISAFKEAEGSSFCRGLNDRHWMATFDWIISERGMTRLLEGRYRDKDGVSHNTSDPVRIDFQRYKDADGEFSVSFETLGNGRKKMTMSYDSGLTKVLEYDNDTRPTWLQ